MKGKPNPYPREKNKNYQPQQKGYRIKDVLKALKEQNKN